MVTTSRNVKDLSSERTTEAELRECKEELKTCKNTLQRSCKVILIRFLLRFRHTFAFGSFFTFFDADVLIDLRAVIAFASVLEVDSRKRAERCSHGAATASEAKDYSTVVLWRSRRLRCVSRRPGHG